MATSQHPTWQSETFFLLLAPAGAADRLPVHTAQLGDFLPELRSLLAHFHLADHTHQLHSAADEMELYSAVTSSHRGKTIGQSTDET